MYIARLAYNDDDSGRLTYMHSLGLKEPTTSYRHINLIDYRASLSHRTGPINHLLSSTA